MSTSVAKILSTETNVAVVQLPNRQFPGSVVQGDSLKCLCDLANEIVSRVSDSEDKELVNVAKELQEQLNGRLVIYEQVLRTHGMALPC